MHQDGQWMMELPVAITVADVEGRIVEMNAKARETFAQDGGAALLGESLYDCHPPRAQAILRELFDAQAPNHYTIEKNGRRKIVHQLPWYRDGVFAGLVEISVPIPEAIPHFNRDAPDPAAR